MQCVPKGIIHHGRRGNNCIGEKTLYMWRYDEVRNIDRQLTVISHKTTLTQIKWCGNVCVNEWRIFTTVIIIINGSQLYVQFLNKTITII